LIQARVGLADFVVTMLLDVFGLSLVEMRQLRPSGMIDAQDFIEFGMQARLPHRLVRWMNSVIMKIASVPKAFQ
jgi:hypothetical protein